MSVLKKVIVRSSQLPPVNADDTYVFRYRIISTDRNKVSEWSQTYSLFPNTITANYDISINSDGANITGQIYVDQVSPNPSYDIFLSWSYDNESTFTNYEYFNTLEKTDSFSVIIPTVGTLADHIRVVVQSSTPEHAYNADYILVSSGSVSTDATIANFPNAIDGGSPS